MISYTLTNHKVVLTQQGTLGGMALVYMYTATDKGLWMGVWGLFASKDEVVEDHSYD